jgi:hypothetical protein
MQRRLLIGVMASVAVGAFALVPSQQLVLKPSKPMYFYLVPLLRAQVRLSIAPTLLISGCIGFVFVVQGLLVS